MSATDLGGLSVQKLFSLRSARRYHTVCVTICLDVPDVAVLRRLTAQASLESIGAKPRPGAFLLPDVKLKFKRTLRVKVLSSCVSSKSATSQWQSSTCLTRALGHCHHSDSWRHNDAGLYLANADVLGIRVCYSFVNIRSFRLGLAHMWELLQQSTSAPALL